MHRPWNFLYGKKIRSDIFSSSFAVVIGEGRWQQLSLLDHRSPLLSQISRMIISSSLLLLTDVSPTSLLMGKEAVETFFCSLKISVLVGRFSESLIYNSFPSSFHISYLTSPSAGFYELKSRFLIIPSHATGSRRQTDRGAWFLSPLNRSLTIYSALFCAEHLLKWIGRRLRTLCSPVHFLVLSPLEWSSSSRRMTCMSTFFPFFYSQKGSLLSLQVPRSLRTLLILFFCLNNLRDHPAP